MRRVRGREGRREGRREGGREDTYEEKRGARALLRILTRKEIRSSSLPLRSSPRVVMVWGMERACRKEGGREGGREEGDAK